MRKILFSAMLTLPLMCGAYAQAQEEVIAPPPAVDMPLPTATNTPASFAQTSFPELPPSRPCKIDDIYGIWTLTHVYENPQGAETRGFSLEPFQYLRFGRDTTYKSLKVANRFPSAKAFFDNFVRKEGEPLNQFTMQDGFIYFYNEGTVADTQACFIVANATPNFKVGEMLLMPPAPPAGQAASIRVMKLYHNTTPKPRGKRRK